MTSDRWAAVTREQRLLNPHLVLRDAVARPRLATTAPPATIDGRAHRVLVVDATCPRSVCTSTTETRTTVRANRSIAGSQFAIPGSLGATFDRALAARGARETEWLMSFVHLGFPRDGAAARITPRPLAAGSTLSRASRTTR